MPTPTIAAPNAANPREAHLPALNPTVAVTDPNSRANTIGLFICRVSSESLQNFSPALHNIEPAMPPAATALPPPISKAL